MRTFFSPLAILACGLLFTAPGCGSAPQTVESYTEPELLLDAGGVPVLFRRSGGPWYVRTAATELPASAVHDGIRVFLGADAYQGLNIDGWSVESAAGSLVLRLASAEFRMQPPTGRALVVQGSQVEASQEWYESHRELLTWLSRERARHSQETQAASTPTGPANPSAAKGYIWRVE